MSKEHLLNEFIDEISEAERIHPRASRLPITRANALDAARFIRDHLDGSSRGGRSAKGRSGPKVKTRTPAAKKNRERVRRHRAKKAGRAADVAETLEE